MKSSTAKLRKAANAGRISLTREQAEKIAAVEGMVLSARMRHIVELPISGEERRALVKARIRKK